MKFEAGQASPSFMLHRPRQAPEKAAWRAERVGRGPVNVCQRDFARARLVSETEATARTAPDRHSDLIGEGSRHHPELPLRREQLRSQARRLHPVFGGYSG